MTFHGFSKCFEDVGLSDGDRITVLEQADPLHEHDSRASASWYSAPILRPILGKWVYDPTSGFVGVNREALAVFSRSFPLEYPEIEALVVLQRKAFRFEEVPCKVRPRKAGKSSITAMKSIYYIMHVLLGVFVNILKFERREEEIAYGPASAGARRIQRRADGDGAVLGSPRAHSRRVFGQLADRGDAFDTSSRSTASLVRYGWRGTWESRIRRWW